MANRRFHMATVLAAVAVVRASASLDDLMFENSGEVSNSMDFTTRAEPCAYLEPEAPTRADWAWAVTGSHEYAYQVNSSVPSNMTCKVSEPAQGFDRPGDDMTQVVFSPSEKDPVAKCGSECCNTTGCVAWVFALAPADFGNCKTGQPCCYLKSSVPSQKANKVCTSGTVSKPVVPVKAPPLGMRSAPPLGGWTTGSLELRADGSFSEITILGQSPGNAPKWADQDGFMLAIRGESTRTGASAVAAMRTHPPAGVTGVSALQFAGASPVTRLRVSAGGSGSQGLLTGTTVHGFGRVRFGRLQDSHTPGVTFAVTFSKAAEFTSAYVLLTVPLGEQNLSRLAGGDVLATPVGMETPTQCMLACNQNSSCQSWVLRSPGDCVLQRNNPVPLPAVGVWSGPRSAAIDQATKDGQFCAVAQRLAMETLGGEIAACAADALPGFGWGSQVDVFSAFQAVGSVAAVRPSFNSSGGAPVAAIVARAQPSSALAPDGNMTALLALSWNFPNKTFVGEQIGQYYTLNYTTLTAAQHLLNEQDVAASLDHYAAVQDALRPSVMPVSVRDTVINTLEHFRMPFWTLDGRIRSFEAYDCVNIDSIHNDHERSVPNLMAMPEFAVSKMRAWAAGQLADGMLQEQLGCGCTGAVPRLDEPCGRVMSDVSSHFIVYLLELLYGGYTDVVKELWPNAARAADWHISVSQEFGVPKRLQTTYDVLGLNAYDTSTYSSLFHILAMKACSRLAAFVGDAAQQAKCDNATVVAQAALDARHWVEDAGPPPPGVPRGNHSGPWGLYRSYCDGGDSTQCGADAVSATMADDTFAQAEAYNLGLGTLVANETRLRLHLQSVAARHETPYGMLIMVGRELPYPGTNRDNALWQMASPNWAVNALGSGLTPTQDSSTAWPTVQRALAWWRSNDEAPGSSGRGTEGGTASRNPDGLADLWNIAGVAGGIEAEQEGGPWITSHYGYVMTAWRLHMATSGQLVDLSQGSFRFWPLPGNATLPGSWSVVMVGALGKLQLQPSAKGPHLAATLSLVAGPTQGVPISSWTVGPHTCALTVTRLTVGTPVTCELTDSSIL